MKINKNNLKLILDTKKHIEKLFSEFVDQYGQIFDKKENLEYEEIINLDLEIYNQYLNFISVLIKIEFNYELIEDEHIKKIIYDLINDSKLSPDEFYLSEKFDYLYYSYLLCEMYIVIPYILQIYFEQEYLIKHPTWSIEKIKSKVKIHKLTKYLHKTIKCFEAWDKLESNIDRLTIEVDEKHPQSKHTYLEIQKTFSHLMNNFILIKFDLKISNKIIFISRLKANWYWMLTISVLLIVLIILIILSTTANI